MDWAFAINLLAALGSCAAAIVAVVIATGDRRERNRERLNAAKAQATLVLLDVRLGQGFLGFSVDIRNFGAEAVLDIELDSAQFARFPAAKPKVVNKSGTNLKVVDADRNPASLHIEFHNEDGDSVITGTRDRLNSLVINDAQPSDLIVTIRFMDAEGNRWLRSLNSLVLAK